MMNEENTTLNPAENPTRYALSVDHLVLAAPDLDAAVLAVESALGVELEAGGAHPGLGTRNRLLGLGSGAYLEVIAPDPEQPEPSAPRPFGIDALEAPTLVTWALRVEGADTPAGYESFRAMSRRRPDGSVLSWRLAFPAEGSLVPGPVQPVPFLIDWGPVDSGAGVPPGAALPEAVTIEALHLTGGAEVAAAVHVAGHSTVQPADGGPAVEVLLSRGEPGVEAVLRVGDREVVWKGSIAGPSPAGT